MGWPRMVLHAGDSGSSDAIQSEQARRAQLPNYVVRGWQPAAPLHCTSTLQPGAARAPAGSQPQLLPWGKARKAASLPRKGLALPDPTLR